ncbi:PD-(D/E)XK nuclease family protein [Acaryochloris marina]|uniref:RecB family exonuclease n=1 Tax=Acaryochloris marina TaxID=155978 RepID=UPI001BAE6685|nr:PD-(D/E)XK nuclease family protein [Acaryochloris marina]QUY40477.1 PD-(D/E)XK nuclease family protein [Acaryochloris marina S15]
MAYPLSATKLQTYRQCPQAYYFKHERRLTVPSAFGSPTFGKAIHRALAQIYQDWSYADPLPPLQWFADCWQQHISELKESQIHEGWQALETYYHQYVAPQPMLRKPVGIEGKIQASFQVSNIEFALSGRYDRLDWLDDGLELIDYKTSKTVKPPEAIDVQLGLYYLALEQTYHHALKRLSLIYLRSNQCISYEVTPDHLEQIKDLIGDLALKLRSDQDWHPQEGSQCDRCGYRQYCSAQTPNPEPLPQTAKPPQKVQLALPFL